MAQVNSVRKSRICIALPALFILLWSAFFGIQHIDAEYIVYDELTSFGNIGGFDPPYSPSDIVHSLIRHSPEHVPLWFILASGFAQLTGWSQAALSYVSVLTSLLAFAIIYRTVQMACDKRAALLVLFLIATCDYLLTYTYRIRMYSLLVLVGVTHFHFYWRFTFKFASLANWILLLLSAIAMLYTHVFAWLLLIGMGINHLFFVSRSRGWASVIAAWALAGLAFLLYVPNLARGFGRSVAEPSFSAPVAFLSSFANAFVNDQLWLWFMLLFALAYAVMRRRQPSVMASLRIGIVSFIVYLLALIVLNPHYKAPVRYLLVMWFLYLTPFAWALSLVPRRLLMLFIAVWSLFFIVDTSDSGSGGDHAYRPAAAASLPGIFAPGDFFIGAFDPKSNDTKLGKHGYSAVDLFLRGYGLESRPLKMSRSSDEIQAEFDWIYHNYARFLLGHQPANAPEQLPHLIGLIDAEYVACAKLLDDPSMTVTRYVDRAIGCEHQAIPVAYRNGINVRDRFAVYQPETHRLQMLTWIEAADSLQERYHNVSWQVHTWDGQNVRQIDKHLHDSSVLPWSRIEMSTEGLGPGDYRLMLILYRNDTGAKVRYVDPLSGQESGFLPILDFAISSGSD